MQRRIGRSYQTFKSGKLLTTRLVDRRRDGCGWPMGDGCDRDEPAEQIRGSVCCGTEELARTPKLQTAMWAVCGRRGQMQIGSGAEERCLSVGGCRMVFLVLRYNEDSNRVVASAQKGTNRG
ncbi:hypothetical protein KCV06_g629, partial [Aureobasidium melanogenum]